MEDKIKRVGLKKEDATNRIKWWEGVRSIWPTPLRGENWIPIWWWWWTIPLYWLWLHDLLVLQLQFDCGIHPKSEAENQSVVMRSAIPLALFAENEKRKINSFLPIITISKASRKTLCLQEVPERWSQRNSNNSYECTGSVSATWYHLSVAKQDKMNFTLKFLPAKRSTFNILHGRKQ